MKMAGIEGVVIVPVECFSYFLESFSNKLSNNLIYENTLIVGNQYIEQVGPRDKWFEVEMQLTKHHNECDSIQEIVKINRLMHIVCISDLILDSIIISEDDMYNLTKLRYPVYDVPYFSGEVKVNLNNATIKRPVKASEVKICIVKNINEDNIHVVDALLMKYFKRERYLCKGDIFSVDVSKYLPEFPFTKGHCNLTVFHFLICDITGPNYKADLENNVGYLVDDSVSLYQLTTQNHFLPPKYHLFFKKQQISDNLLCNVESLQPLVPSSLQMYQNELTDLFRPFLAHKLDELDLSPLFMVVGPFGCGKSLLLKSVAAHLGLHYWKVDCCSVLNGTTIGYNEARLRELFRRLEKNLPCLVHMDNFEAICEGNDGHEDVRLIGSFKSFLTGMDRMSELPFIVVGTTSPNKTDDISSELMQLVLHSVYITTQNGNSVSAIEERSETIEWLCRSRFDCPLSIKQLAHQVALSTSGFLLADLDLLVKQASKEEYIKCKVDCNYENDLNRFVSFDNFDKIVDRMNAELASDVGAPKVPKVSWSDVGGHKAIKKEIVRSINTSSFGTALRRSGLLLWGPPGTGKTLLAKAVATECGSTFLSVKGPELLNMYIGQSEENVRQVFERARSAAPCIVFFDELDSLAPNRGNSGDSCGVMDRVVSQLLSEMDGLQSNENVFVLGATNRPDLIDPALLRPGRLDKMLYVGPCEDSDSKFNVLKALTRKFEMNSDVDLKMIANRLPSHLTGADLYSVCYGAWQNAAKNVIKMMKIDCSPSAAERGVCDTAVKVSADDFLSAISNLPINS